jgi:hypothetical protein
VQVFLWKTLSVAHPRRFRARHWDNAQLNHFACRRVPEKAELPRTEMYWCCVLFGESKRHAPRGEKEHLPEKSYFYIMASLLEPRISVLQYLRRQYEMLVSLSVLPPTVYWINTMGATASLVKNTGLVARAAVESFPSGFIPEEMPYLEGPFLSEEHVEQCSVAYHLIIRPNSVKAARILLLSLQKKYPDATHYLTDEFIGHLPYIIEHTFIGNSRGSGITGVHYNTSDVRINKLIRSSMHSPTPFSLIKKVNPLTGDVLSKSQPSTFWPLEWGIERCVIECAIAWSNRAPSNSKDVHVGCTSTGLMVKFCFRGGVLKTVYPDETNNELVAQDVQQDNSNNN